MRLPASLIQMRRIPRLESAIDILCSHSSIPSSSFCLGNRRTLFSTSTWRAARPGSSPYLEKMRRKIWGTDQPPGQEDPYERTSAIEQFRSKKSGSSEIEEDSQGYKQLPTPPTPTHVAELGTYEPATTWDGLDVVGRLKDKEFHFAGFLPKRKVKGRFEAMAALHQAVVEVFALKQANKPLSLVWNSGKEDLTGDIQIRVSPSNPSDIILDFPESVPEARLLEYLADESAPDSDTVMAGGEVTGDAPGDSGLDTRSDDPLAEGEGINQNTNYPTQIASWDQVWFQVSLEDPEVKFAIIKRVMRLSGVHIPDPALNSIRTVKSLLVYLVKPPKPKKLIEVLVKKGDLVSLPNVKIFDHRVTPIDREKSIGRWKIIEKALEAKGLPVIGH